MERSVLFGLCIIIAFWLEKRGQTHLNVAHSFLSFCNNTVVIV